MLLDYSALQRCAILSFNLSYFTDNFSETETQSIMTQKIVIFRMSWPVRKLRRYCFSLPLWHYFSGKRYFICDIKRGWQLINTHHPEQTVWKSYLENTELLVQPPQNCCHVYSHAVLLHKFSLHVVSFSVSLPWATSRSEIDFPFYAFSLQLIE